MVNILVQYKLVVLMVPIIISETVLKDNLCVLVYSCMFVKPNDRFVLFSFFPELLISDLRKFHILSLEISTSDWMPKQ